MDTQTFEKLGAFYLGRDYDIDTKELSDAPLLYDSRDLMTHAVVVGMTGSGKTGLCIGLLEEAALDGVPALVIDPKGDIGNLLLTFPELAPADFEPWIDPETARRKDTTVEAYAEGQANLWRNGLEQWGQDRERIQRLRDAADFAIYTPGSSAGLSLSLVKSFSAPPEALREDRDLYQDRISNTVSGLLGLIGVDADPIQSREHILLSTILNHAWSQGQDIELAGLIHAVQEPPFERVGVLDLDTFFPQKSRFGLAMQLNNLLASPSFASWMEGDPLDISKLLYTAEGKPRVAVLSIAHLSESERMFFVSLLLTETIGWMRSQSGTTNLRALLYMDEIYGYLPPVANPPSKKPLLTLMKQARAFGLGVVLATQNPVDIDYKALSNAGTWMIGRLQTERDKLRLLDALEAASAESNGAFERKDIERIISGLDKRVFLLHNVHESQPRIFQTRWVMSYLCGPLTRDQIRQLMDPIKAEIQAAIEAEAAAQEAADSDISDVAGASQALPAIVQEPEGSVAESMALDASMAPSVTAIPPAVNSPQSSPSDTPTEPAVAANPAPALPVAPELSASIEQYFVPLTSDDIPPNELVYKPAAFAFGEVYLQHAKSGVAMQQPLRKVCTMADGPVPVDWTRAYTVGLDPNSLLSAPQAVGAFLELPRAASDSRNFTAWKASISDWAYRNARESIGYAKSIDTYSRPGESPREFRLRIAPIIRQERDTKADALRITFRKRFDTAQERIDTALRQLDKEQGQADRAKRETRSNIGSTVLSAIFGNTRSAVRGGASTAKKATYAREQKEDVAEAQEKVDLRRDEMAQLEDRFRIETDEIDRSLDTETASLEEVEIAPRRKDVTIQDVVLLWIPIRTNPDGTSTLACDLR